MTSQDHSLEVLMATMNRVDDSFLARVGLDCPTTIVNQAHDQGESTFTVNGHYVRMLTVAERGLSKSRNLAITKAAGDLCILTDDDVVFDPDYARTVRRAYSGYPDADIIVFQVPRIGDPARSKRYSKMPGNLGWRGILRVSSVEITFRRKSVLAANLQFDTRFGAGSSHLMGEETIFLLDALRAGLVVFYVPERIASTDVSESSWFTAFDARYFHAKGAAFRRMFPCSYGAAIIAFVVRKRRLYEPNMSPISAFRHMLRGARAFQP